MFKLAKPFFLKVETPLHAGSGSDLGVVDLPIQREKHTDFPKIESSSLKGSIREVFEEKYKDSKQAIDLIFGPESGDEHAGALGFTDARILLFPVRSLRGIFAWITCPAVVKRFISDLKLCCINDIQYANKAKKITESSKLVVGDSNIVLEEYTFSVEKDKNLSELAKWLSANALPDDTDNYWKEKVKDDIVLLDDDEFRDFVTLSTEVIARTKIDNEKGTVKEGALFYEEYLPSETILYSLALASPIFSDDKASFKNGGKEEEKVMEFFAKGIPNVIQIGGNATIGKGIVRIKVDKEG